MIPVSIRRKRPSYMYMYITWYMYVTLFRIESFQVKVILSESGLYKSTSYEQRYRRLIYSYSRSTQAMLFNKLWILPAAYRQTVYED